MLEPGTTPGLTRWQELNGAVDTVLARFEAVIEFGVLTYPANTECNTSGPQVRFGLYNRTKILNHLSSQTPAGGTPTAAALTNAASSLKALGSPDTAKFLILATDGGPNCNYALSASPSCTCGLTNATLCCTNYPAPCYFGQNCLDDERTVNVIKSLATQGIQTFVIGLPGSGGYAEVLDKMAVAGGRPNTGGTYYYAPTNQAELAAALETIAGSIISCRIDLQQTPEFPDGVLVYMDGVKVPRDPNHAHGWDYANEEKTTIEFYGPTCEAFQDGKEHNVVATFPCPVY